MEELAREQAEEQEPIEAVRLRHPVDASHVARDGRASRERQPTALARSRKRTQAGARLRRAYNGTALPAAKAQGEAWARWHKPFSLMED